MFLTALPAIRGDPGLGGPGGPGPDKPEYSTSLETSLRRELFTGYEVLQRPHENVRIFISLTILTVNDLVNISINCQLIQTIEKTSKSKTLST